jgi:hypothetical protein
MSQTSPAASLHPAAPTRRYDLDWLRIIAFTLLILYHVGMFFVSWGWHVKSPHAGPAAEPLMMLLNPWRLPLLFFISGVAFAFLHDKLGAARFAGERLLRLLPVIVFGMIVVVMPQTYFQLLQAGEIEAGILAFWPRYMTGWEIAGVTVPTWNHLWYVVYLMAYALMLAPLLPLLKGFASGPGAALGRLWETPAGPALLLVLPALPLLIWRITLVPHFETTHDLTWDWANHANSLTFLLIGVFAARSERFWTAVDRALPLALGLSIALAATLSLAWASWEQVSENAIITWIARTGRVLYMWIAIVTLLGLARRFLNGDGPVRRYLTEAVFPVYILHQTITVSAGYYLAQTWIGVWSEFTLLTALTLAGSFAGFEIVRRVPVLRPLFGLKPRARKTPPQAAAGLSQTTGDKA